MKLLVVLVLVAVGLMGSVSADWLRHSSPEVHVQNFKSFVQNERRVLDGNQIAGLQNLRQNLQNSGFNVNAPGADLTYTSIKKAIAGFVRQSAGEFGNSKSEKERFDEFLERAVIGPCKILIRDLPKNAYKELIHSPEVQNQLDMDTKEWLVTSRVCLAIVDKSKTINLESYETLLNHKYHKSSLGQLLHKAHLH